MGRSPAGVSQLLAHIRPVKCATSAIVSQPSRCPEYSSLPFRWKCGKYRPSLMNTKYLDAALVQFPNRELLVNLVSRRVRQLSQGHRPLTVTNPKMIHADVALKEIAEGKFSYEVLTEEEVKAAAALL
jgi:DNA-directed RNA polymerase subunit omega